LAQCQDRLDALHVRHHDVADLITPAVLTAAA
jgi:hypothetical protein